MRGKVNDKILLFDGCGTTAEATVTSVDAKKVGCRVDSLVRHTLPKKRIHLYLAPPRHNLLSPLIKQCVELGLWQIHLIECDFSVAKPKEKDELFRNELLAGAKQSGNPFFPEIFPMKKFNNVLENCQLKKFYGATPSENKGELVVVGEEEISLWIGPEGGFSENELEKLRKSGAQGITIGEWILRVETALVSLLGILCLKTAIKLN
jgi:16S rRNA (uracil1498-N3)-methyltransferase